MSRTSIIRTKSATSCPAKRVEAGLLSFLLSAVRRRRGTPAEPRDGGVPGLSLVRRRRADRLPRSGSPRAPRRRRPEPLSSLRNGRAVRGSGRRQHRPALRTAVHGVRRNGRSLPPQRRGSLPARAGETDGRAPGLGCRVGGGRAARSRLIRLPNGCAASPVGAAGPTRSVAVRCVAAGSPSPRCASALFSSPRGRPGGPARRSPSGGPAA